MGSVGMKKEEVFFFKSNEYDQFTHIECRKHTLCL